MFVYSVAIATSRAFRVCQKGPRSCDGAAKMREIAAFQEVQKAVITNIVIKIVCYAELVASKQAKINGLDILRCHFDNCRGAPKEIICCRSKKILTIHRG